MRTYKISDIIQIIEDFAPLSSQYSYDHCGLKTGNIDEKVTGILTALDINEEVIDEAVEKKCNLIIEHHPSIWQPLSCINTFFPKTKALLKASQNGISIYSAHTNIDIADGGLNDFFALQIGLKNIEKYPEYRIGELKSVSTATELSKFIANTIQENNIRIIGDKNKKIKKVAVINGAGGGEEDLIFELARKKTDCLVTAEVKYNVARLSKDINYVIIEVGHFTSEKAFSQVIEKIIGKSINDLPIYSSEKLQNPYSE